MMKTFMMTIITAMMMLVMVVSMLRMLCLLGCRCIGRIPAHFLTTTALFNLALQPQIHFSFLIMANMMTVAMMIVILRMINIAMVISTPFRKMQFMSLPTHTTLYSC